MMSHKTLLLLQKKYIVVASETNTQSRNHEWVNNKRRTKMWSSIITLPLVVLPISFSKWENYEMTIKMVMWTFPLKTSNFDLHFVAFAEQKYIKKWIKWESSCFPFYVLVIIITTILIIMLVPITSSSFMLVNVSFTCKKKLFFCGVIGTDGLTWVADLSTALLFWLLTISYMYDYCRQRGY